mgnify:CR=1 FL=1|jgi:hypothetical protein
MSAKYLLGHEKLMKLSKTHLAYLGMSSENWALPVIKYLFGACLISLTIE